MTEQRRLNSWVHVRRDAQDPGAWFGPDDHLPEWAVEQLRDNPRVWATDEDEPTPTAPSAQLMGHSFEPGELVSNPMTTTTGQLPPSSTPMSHPRSGSSRSSAPADADKGIAEARRRFGPPPDAA